MRLGSELQSIRGCAHDRIDDAPEEEGPGDCEIASASIGGNEEARCADTRTPGTNLLKSCGGRRCQNRTIRIQLSIFSRGVRILTRKG